MQKEPVRVLLVDDDEEDFMIIRNMLADANVCRYHLDWANTYADGLEKLNQAKYDAILLDYSLGERNGLEFLNQAIGNNREIPFILLTARGQTEVDMEAMRAGASDYLEKDWVSPHLLDCSIRYAIQNKLNEIELRRYRDSLQELVLDRTRLMEEKSEQLGLTNQMLQLEVAERAKAEEALRHSEAKYRGLIEATDTGYVILDTAGRVLDANAEYVRLTGYDSFDEIAGRSILEWTSHHDLEKTNDRVRNCAAEGGVRGLEVDYVDREGRITPVEINGTVTQTEDGEAIICLIRDISERRQMEHELQEANFGLEAKIAERTAELAALNEYLENIFENSPDIIVITDKSGKLIKWNKAAFRHAGYDPKEFGELRAFDLYPNKEQLDRILASLRRDGSVRDFVIDMKKKHGEIVPLQVSISVLKNSEGRTIGSVAVSRDITETRKAEEEIRRLSRLYDVLSQVNRAISRTRSRDELLSTICRHVVERGKIDLAWIGWLDPETTRIDPVAYFGNQVGMLSEGHHYADDQPEGQGNPGKAIREERSFVCNECGARACPYPSEQAPVRFGFQSCGSFPFRLMGEPCGALTVCVAKQNFFQEREIELLSEVAAEISFALDKIESDLQRDRLNKQYQEQSMFLQSLIEAMPCQVFYKDTQLRYLGCNTAYEQLVGLQKDQILGRTAHDIWPEDLADLYSGADRQLLANPDQQSVTHEEMVQWPEGVRRYYLTNKAVFLTQEGAIGGIIGSTMEITERKRSEEALYKSEMYNRSLIEHLPQRIFLKDCNSVYISCNVNYARDLGIEPEQITGKDDFDFYPRKLADSYRSDDRTVIASGMSKDVEERYIVGGQEKWVHTVKVPYRDESGKVIGVLGIFDDVSERKAAEAAIQESEAKFRSYIEHAPLAVLVSDREGRLLDFNPSAVNFLGCDADKLLGMNILDLPAEDDRETALHDFTILLEEGHLEGEYRLRSRDGQVAWVSLHAVMITDKLVLAYCRDITGHKRREAAEGVSHRFLQITHEHSEIMPLLGEFVSEIKKYTGCDAVGIRVLDDEGNIPYQAYEGFSQKFFDSESPLSIKSDRCMCINVIKGDIDPSLPFYTEGGSFLVNATSRFLASVSEEEKGQTRNVCNLEGYETVGLFPFRKNGRILGLIHVADHREDMVPPHVATVLEEAALQLGTAFERIYAEHQLKESEAKFRSYVQNAPEAILVQTRGLWSYVNPAAMKLLGASSKDELIGRSPLEILHPDYRESVKERMRLINVHKKSVAAQEQKFIKLDGTIVDVESLAVPVRYENEDGALVFVRDISERRKAEEERARLEVQLRQAQKLESIGQLAAGIAHEINTPAQYVGDNTRFLQEACADFERVFVLYNQLLEHLKSREQAKEFVEKIEKTAEEVDLQYLREEAPNAVIQSLDGIERISRIVRAMKEFSHPGTDTKTAIDLNRAIESTITVARNEWKYVAEMETDLDPSLPLVPCLPAEINQVILNMIINASHAIADVVKKGGSDRKGTIKITTHTRDNYAQISISDTGTGIPENIRSRIFDPFFTTKGVGKGSGQGLAISHSVVVDKHGGTITFDSEMGKGSVFVVRLPLDQGSETSGRA